MKEEKMNYGILCFRVDLLMRKAFLIEMYHKYELDYPRMAFAIRCRIQEVDHILTDPYGLVQRYFHE